MRLLLRTIFVYFGIVGVAHAACPNKDFDTVDPKNNVDLVQFVECVNFLKNINLILDEKLASGSAESGNAAQAQVTTGPFKSKAVVIVSATGNSTFNIGHPSNVANAGILLTVSLNGKPVAVDNSFEGSSNGISFQSAASYNFTLEKGKKVIIGASIEAMGSVKQKFKNTAVELKTVAIRANLQ